MAWVTLVSSTFLPHYSSTAVSGQRQPAQSTCSSKRSYVIITIICVKRMPRRVEGNVGSYAAMGRITPEGRTEECHT